MLRKAPCGKGFYRSHEAVYRPHATGYRPHKVIYPTYKKLYRSYKTIYRQNGSKSLFEIHRFKDALCRIT